MKSAQQVRIRAAQSLGASRAQVLWFVILPGALPEILTGLRIGLGVGWSTGGGGADCRDARFGFYGPVSG
ncbi:hypothetical protein ECZU03_35000 [Escherichia coli]|nr:hypothetical protein ECZU03_35000 [Escherichia coli]